MCTQGDVDVVWVGVCVCGSEKMIYCNKQAVSSLEVDHELFISEVKTKSKRTLHM